MWNDAAVVSDGMRIAHLRVFGPWRRPEAGTGAVGGA